MRFWVTITHRSSEFINTSPSHLLLCQLQQTHRLVQATSLIWPHFSSLRPRLQQVALTRRLGVADKRLADQMLLQQWKTKHVELFVWIIWTERDGCCSKMPIIKHNRSGSVCPHQPEERRKVKRLNTSVKKRSLCSIQLTSSLELILHFSLYHLLRFSRSHCVWLIAAIKTKNNLHVLFFYRLGFTLCTSSIPSFLISLLHLPSFLSLSTRICFSTRRGFQLCRRFFMMKSTSQNGGMRAETIYDKKNKKNWRDPETLMHQRILLSPCLCSALLNPPPTVVFSLSLSQVSSDRWLLSSKKELTDYTRVQEFTAEEGEVGKTFRVSPN